MACKQDFRHFFSLNLNRWMEQLQHQKSAHMIGFNFKGLPSYINQFLKACSSNTKYLQGPFGAFVSKFTIREQYQPLTQHHPALCQRKHENKFSYKYFHKMQLCSKEELLLSTGVQL